MPEPVDRPAASRHWPRPLGGIALALLLPGRGVPAAAAPVVDWPAAQYNPSPLPDDLILPLPCGGAMAFRPVATGGAPTGVGALSPELQRLYRVAGRFDPFLTGTGHLLMGKYEVTRLQFRAVSAATGGGDCPQPDDRSALPQVEVNRRDAEGFGIDLSQWLADNASRLPDCTAGGMPCLPRVEGVAATVRLPDEDEWTFAARGGLAVGAAEFAALAYPMPQGLARSVIGKRQGGSAPAPIGGPRANPLGLHDMLGNVEEIMLDLYRVAGASGEIGGYVVRGGSFYTPPADMAVSLRREVPILNKTSDTGFRVIAAVPVYTSARRLAEIQEADAAAPGETPEPEPRTTSPEPPGVALLPLPAGPAEPPTAAPPAGLRIELLGLVARFGAVPLAVAAALGIGVAAGVPWLLGWLRRRRRRAALAAVTPQMVELLGGTFWMGSPESEAERTEDEGPRREVEVQSFAIGKNLITFDQYDAFAGATGRQLPKDSGWGRGEQPVIDVSWYDALAYADWLSAQTGRRYRLPTEEEWEYAARASTDTPFYTGDCINTRLANYDGTNDYRGCGAKTRVFRKRTVPVGSLPANPWGLHDMAGNLWEWTRTACGEAVRGIGQGAGDGTSELTDLSQRVIRGGSWNDRPGRLRSASRLRAKPSYRLETLGFRVAREI